MRAPQELLYRSPNRLIDGVEWHVRVIRTRAGGSAERYQFRKSRDDKWLPLTSWKGPLPKGLRGAFQNYRRSILVAHESLSHLRAIA